MNAKNILMVTALAALMTGCTVAGTKKNFGCSGLPDGVVCKTPTQIYDMTNGDQMGVYQQDLDRANHQAESSNSMFKGSSQPKIQGKPNGAEAQMVNLFAKPQFQANSNPMPVLEQPRVLRIWVAPWKDEHETLNWGSYMFTEITPRRWNFGDSVMRNTPITAPNQADYKSASATVDASGKPLTAADREVANINQSIDAANNPAPVQAPRISESLQRQNQFVDQGAEFQ